MEGFRYELKKNQTDETAPLLSDSRNSERQLSIKQVRCLNDGGLALSKVILEDWQKLDDYGECGLSRWRSMWHNGQ